MLIIIKWILNYKFQNKTFFLYNININYYTDTLSSERSQWFCVSSAKNWLQRILLLDRVYKVLKFWVTLPQNISTLFKSYIQVYSPCVRFNNWVQNNKMLLRI